MGTSEDPSLSNDSINQLLSITSEKETVKRAFNQLLLAIAGSEHGKTTFELKDTMGIRVKKCTELAMGEYAEANSLLNDCVPDARRMISQTKSKLESLHSLAIIANFLEMMIRLDENKCKE